MNSILTMDIAGVADPASPDHLHRSVEHVRTCGREVRVDMFGEAPHPPVVLLLHGVGGLLGDGALLKRLARGLAAEGLRAAIVHYFNATGTLFATQANVREHAETWKAAVADVARHYAAEGPSKVGLFGYSLGGHLAAAAGAEAGAVGAVAVLCGGLFDLHGVELPERLPALLILHGDHDAKVPPDRAEALGRRAWHGNGFVDTVMYPNEGHSFGASAERDALRRAVDFFQRRLGAGIRC